MIALLRFLLISGAISGSTWGSLAALEQTTDNPGAAAARHTLEQIAAATLDGAGAIPSTIVDGASRANDLLGAIVTYGAESDEPGRTRGQIVRVADGDTITVRTGAGEKVKIRLLGIDAPESTTLRRGHAECGGTQAKALMQRLAAEYPRVTLVSDPSQDDVDRYGRHLAYVVPTGGGVSFQERVLRAGWAQVYVFRKSSPPTRTSRFRAAAAQARGERRGVWQACGGSFTQPL